MNNNEKFNGFKSQEQFEKTKELVGNVITDFIENHSDFELDSYDVFRLTDDEGLNAMSIVFTANIGYEKPNWVSFNIEIHSNGYMRVLTHKSVKEIPFAIVCIISSIWTIVGNDVFADVFGESLYSCDSFEEFKEYLSRLYKCNDSIELNGITIESSCDEDKCYLYVSYTDEEGNEDYVPYCYIDEEGNDSFDEVVIDIYNEYFKD